MQAHENATIEAQNRLSALLNLAQIARVFPLKQNDKVPLLQGSWTDYATQDEAQIKEWFNTHLLCNWGAVANLNYIGLDVDNKKGKDGSASLENIMREQGLSFDDFPPPIKTPSNGFHYYFKLPDGRTSPFHNGTDKGSHGGLDVRSGSAYLVAPLSSIDGKQYTMPNGLDFANIPVLSVELEKILDEWDKSETISDTPAPDLIQITPIKWPVSFNEFINNEHVNDRSLIVFEMAKHLQKLKLSGDEILAQLWHVDAVKQMCMSDTRRHNQASAIKWLWKYTVSKVLDNPLNYSKIILESNGSISNTPASYLSTILPSIVKDGLHTKKWDDEVIDFKALDDDGAYTIQHFSLSDVVITACFLAVNKIPSPYISADNFISKVEEIIKKSLPVAMRATLIKVMNGFVENNKQEFYKTIDINQGELLPTTIYKQVDELKNIEIVEGAINIVRADYGTGKTSIIAKRVVDKHKNKTVVLNNSVALIDDFSTKLNIQNYQDIKDNAKAANKILNEPLSDATGSVGICINSLTHPLFDKILSESTALVVDEFTQTLDVMSNHVFIGGEYNKGTDEEHKNTATKIYNRLINLIVHNTTSVLLDANMDTASINWIESIVPKTADSNGNAVPMKDIVVHHVSQKSPLNLKSVRVSHSETQAFEDIQLAVLDDQKVLVASTTLSAIIKVDNDQKVAFAQGDEPKQSIMVTSETSSDDDVRELMKSPNEYIKNHPKLDLFGYSPSITAGVSITVPHFTKHLLLVDSGILPATYCMQQGARDRTIEHLDVVLTFSISMANQRSGELKDGYALLLGDDFENYETEFTRFCIQRQFAMNEARHNCNNNLIWLYERLGVHIEYVDNLNTSKKCKAEVNELRVNELIAAPRWTDEQWDEHELNDTLNKSKNLAAKQKFLMRKTLRHTDKMELTFDDVKNKYKVIGKRSNRTLHNLENLFQHIPDDPRERVSQLGMTANRTGDELITVRRNKKVQTLSRAIFISLGLLNKSVFNDRATSDEHGKEVFACAAFGGVDVELSESIAKLNAEREKYGRESIAKPFAGFIMSKDEVINFYRGHLMPLHPIFELTNVKLLPELPPLKDEKVSWKGKGTGLPVDTGKVKSNGKPEKMIDKGTVPYGSKECCETVQLDAEFIKRAFNSVRAFFKNHAIQTVDVRKGSRVVVGLEVDAENLKWVAEILIRSGGELRGASRAELHGAGLGLIGDEVACAKAIVEKNTSRLTGRSERLAAIMEPAVEAGGDWVCIKFSSLEGEPDNVLKWHKRTLRSHLVCYKSYSVDELKARLAAAFIKPPHELRLIEGLKTRSKLFKDTLDFLINGYAHPSLLVKENKVPHVGGARVIGLEVCYLWWLG